MDVRIYRSLFIFQDPLYSQILLQAWRIESTAIHPGPCLLYEAMPVRAFAPKLCVSLVDGLLKALIIVLLVDESHSGDFASIRHLVVLA